MIAKMQFPKLRKILRIPLDRLLQPIDTIRVYSENPSKNRRNQYEGIYIYFPNKSLPR